GTGAFLLLRGRPGGAVIEEPEAASGRQPRPGGSIRRPQRLAAPPQSPEPRAVAVLLLQSPPSSPPAHTRMTRWKAAGAHLCISAAIIISLGLAMVLIWYPPGMLDFVGADRLFWVIAGIDIA